MYEYQRTYRMRRRRRATEYLGGECARCGAREGLHFDHVNPATKEKEITQAIVAGWSWERLKVELGKCQLLCQPHHLEKSKAEGSLSNPWNKVEDPDHGTGPMYDRRRCRCDECTTWKRRYRKGEVDHSGNSKPL